MSKSIHFTFPPAEEYVQQELKAEYIVVAPKGNETGVEMDHVFAATERRDHAVALASRLQRAAIINLLTMNREEVPNEG